jgi:FkbM family methyltransferase
MIISFPLLVNKYKLNITGVIHVGGHVGQELPVYKKSNVENILVFEPQKAPFEILSNVANQLSFDNIKLVNKALGNSSQKIKMICNDGGLCSSILNPKIVLDQYPDIIFDRTEEVDMITLDSYFGNVIQNQYNFINMDTQGYELEVLKGSKDSLKNIDAVYTEVNNVEVYENNALIEEIDEFLKIYDMVRVETDWMGGTWGDAFYIKQELI